MPTTFNNDGKPTYMYDSVGDVWYAVGAKVDTASSYEWAGTQTFLNTVTADATVILRDGFNNFLNPAARDAAITSPVQGTLVFVRQDSGGGTINQIQYYTGSAWSALEADITAVTAGTGLTGGGTSGSVTLSLDTTSAYVVPSQTGQNGKYLTTNGTTSSWGVVDALPSQTGNDGKYLTTNGTTASWAVVATDPTPTVFMLGGM